MSTSGGGLLNALAYLAFLVAVLAVAAPPPGGLEAVLRRPRPAALALFGVVAVPSLLQIPFPPLLDALARRPDLIGQGQLWRLVTSVVVQDGGLFGTVFNLAVLYPVACLAVAVWGAARAVALFAAGGFAFDLTTTFAFPAAGAGNSGATFFLATSVLGLLLVRAASARVVGAGAVVAAVGAGLLALLDAHGFAVLGGLVAGALTGLVAPPADVGRFRAVTR